MASCAQCHAPIPIGVRNCPHCGITLAGIEFETHPGTGVHNGLVAPDGMLGRWVLDQYVVRAKLGEGGMGGVYLADQPAIGRQAVIKVIHPWLSRDPGVASRFATEARAAARLQNPHIVSIYNYGKMTDGTLFLAMEHLAGRTLAQLLRAEGRIEPARAVAIATQVCEALGHAHARGVIHRDLKPSNIMLVSRDRGPEFVKVLDFGIAKLDGAEGTAAGTLLGTPQYMSPEQLQGGVVDGRSDLYTLGVVLYEMLAGQPPFLAETAIAYVHKHVSEPPPPLARIVPQLHIPPALDACIMRMLAKAPHQRPQTAEILADDLWSALMATVDSSHVPTPRIAPARPRQGAVALAVGGAAAVVVALGLAAYALVTRGPAPSSEPVAAVAEPSAPVPETMSSAEIEPATDPEHALLLAKSIPELEAEFQRSTILSGMPRESIELALQEYRNAVSAPPPGYDARDYRKRLLADLIIAWRKQRAPTAPTDRHVDELEAVFLTMTSSYTVEQRREMLVQLRSSTAGDPNAEAIVYRNLLEWIAAYGGMEEQIEIIDDDDAIKP